MQPSLSPDPEESLTAELGQARAREAALREILEVISQSRDDDAPVFDVIVRNAARLCNAPMAWLLLTTPMRRTFRLMGYHGLTRQQIELNDIFELSSEPEAITGVGRAIFEARTVQDEDLAQTRHYLNDIGDMRMLVDSEGLRTRLCVPLISGGVGIGAILLTRRVVAPFSPDEIALVETFAAQAVIAIENVRQFRELQVRLAREAATREILEVISQSREDDGPVFDVVLRKAAELCHASMANLSIVSEDRSHAVMMADWGDYVSGVLPVGGIVWQMDSGHANTTCMREGRVVHVHDLADSDLYRSGDPIRTMAVDRDGIGSLLAVPLFNGEQTVACISVYRREVRPFTADEIALVETFAAQAVIAIENVRQFRELQTRLAREAATREILEVISHSRDDDRPVFDTVLRSAIRLCGAQTAALMLGRPADERMTLAAMRDVEDGPAANYDALIAGVNALGPVMDPAVHLGARAICSGKAEQIFDAADTDSYRRGEPTWVLIVDEMGTGSMLSVPLRDASGSVGAINLHRREVRPFSEDEIELVRSFAAQAVIAIENVRQFRELQTRLAREAATREILEVISHSRDDDRPVFETILQSASRLCKAQSAAFLLANEARTHARLMAIHGDTLNIFIGADSALDTGHTPTEAIRTGQCVHIADVRDTDLFRKGDPVRVRLVEETGLRSSLAVPLMHGGRAIGAIVLHRLHEVRPFARDDIDLLESFAAQAVIAIENVRQFRELQTRLAREAATREILEVISQSRDDDGPVFDVILQNVARLCDTSLATFVRVNGPGTHVEYVAHWGMTLKTFDLGTDRWPLDGPLQVARSVKEGRVINTPDLIEDDLYRQGDPTRVRLVDVEGVRSYLTVPLITTHREAIGCIALYRKELKPFTADEVALVETFAAQAVIAIENVRQFRELQTRLEREAATREILEVISQSRDDDRPVFDAVLRKAAELCGAPLAGLNIISEDRSQAVMVAHWGESLRALEPGKTRWLLDSDLVPAIAMREGRVVQEHDLADTDAYRSGDPIRRMAVDEEGIRTIVVVPLFSGGHTIGSIALYRREVLPFTADQIALVETFAAQAVIAIENVHQFRELQTRLEREAATREILEVISQSRDDDGPVFDAVLRNANRLCGTSMAYLVLGRPDDTHMTLAAYVNPYLPSEDSVDQIIAFANQTGMRMDATEHFSARAIISGEVVQIADIAASHGYLSGEPTIRILVEDVGVRTILSVPLFDAQGTIGAISLQRREERLFSDDEITLIRSFAAQAVIAIENVRQFRELQTRLAREAATREILEVISQSRDNDGPVFDVVLRKAAELCHASMAGLNIISEDRSRAVCVAEWGDHVTGLRPVGETVWPMESDHAPSKCMREGRIVHVHDLGDTDLYRSGDPIRVAAVDHEGIRTFLAVPLFSGGKTVSCITIYRRVVRPFTADEIALVETFAAQAVIAIENVRQFRELQVRLEREAATRDILEVISRSRDDDAPVFDMIAQSAARLCGAAVCTFWRIENGIIHYGASHGLQGDAFAETQLTPAIPLVDSTLTGQVFKRRAVARIEDAMAESYLDHEWARMRGLKQLIGVPIFVGDDVWGSINLMWPADRAPREADIQLVESFAAQASIAIENVRQFKALEALNAELGERVQEQVGEIERMGRLKRFLPAAVADAVVSSGSEKMLSSHRALLGVLFCDIRGFTAFCETAEPEETIEVLQTYHEEMGRLINSHGAGVDHRVGDGIMVLFNDPLPCDDPAGDAVRLAMAMRARMAELCGKWKKMGHRLGFGLGVSLGYATVGMVGSGGRFDYTASGTAINLASRLCDEALDGEILISPRVRLAVEDDFTVESRGEISFKGIREPVEVFCVTGVVG